MRSSAAAEHNRAPTLTFGKASHPGHGHANQDAVAAGWNAAGDVLAAALADGIASSEVSGEAASAAVDGFVVDYHCAPAAWSAEVAGRKIIDSACEFVRFVGRTGLGGDGRRYGSYV